MNLNMENDMIVEELEIKHKKQPSNEKSESEGMRLRLRALLVALAGVSLSACALASRPEELELPHSESERNPSDDDGPRRIMKPMIRVVLGCGRLNACVMAITSLMLLIAVMSNESWSRRGSRLLATPALLMVAHQASADAADALLAVVLRVPAAPTGLVVRALGATLLVSVEIIVWYLIAKFFDYEPPQKPENEINKDLLTSYLEKGH